MADRNTQLPSDPLVLATMTMLGFAAIGAFSFAGLCLTLPIGGLASGALTWYLYSKFDPSMSLWKSLVGWSVAGLLAIIITLVFPSYDTLGKTSAMMNGILGGAIGGLVGGAAVTENAESLRSRRLLVLIGWTIGGALGGFTAIYSMYESTAISPLTVGGLFGGAVFGLFGGSFTALAFELGDYA